MGGREAGCVAGSSVDCEGVVGLGWGSMACVWMGGSVEAKWYFRLVPLPREGPDGHLVEARAAGGGGATGSGGGGRGMWSAGAGKMWVMWVAWLAMSAVQRVG